MLKNGWTSSENCGKKLWKIGLKNLGAKVGWKVWLKFSMDKLGVISGLKNCVDKFGWKFGEKIGWKNSMEKFYVNCVEF